MIARPTWPQPPVIRIVVFSRAMMMVVVEIEVVGWKEVSWSLMWGSGHVGGNQGCLDYRCETRHTEIFEGLELQNDLRRCCRIRDGPQ